MKKQRKTKAEKDYEWIEAERIQWERFKSKLGAAQSYEDVLNLYNEAPDPDSPGRRYYSRLGFFLHYFAPPAGASHTELAMYLRIAQIIEGAGRFIPGAYEQVEQDLRRAISTQRD